ncbi:hypothetical protein MKY34_16375 [Sporosarcina sp. FSL K6-1522]
MQDYYKVQEIIAELQYKLKLSHHLFVQSIWYDSKMRGGMYGDPLSER